MRDTIDHQVRGFASDRLSSTSGDSLQVSLDQKPGELFTEEVNDT